MNNIPEGWEIVSSPTMAKNQEAFDPSDWDVVHVPEQSTSEKIRRASYQPIIGAGEFTIPGMVTGAAHSLIGVQKPSGPFLEEQAQERELAEQLGEQPRLQYDPFAQGFEESKQTMLPYIPSVSNLAEGTESLTGVPLGERSELDSYLRLAGGGAKFGPGGLFSKGVSGVLAPTVSATAHAMGLPRGLSDPLGLGVSGLRPGQFKDPLKTETSMNPNVQEELATYLRGDPDIPPGGFSGGAGGSGPGFASDYELGKSIQEATAHKTVPQPAILPKKAAPITNKITKSGKDIGIRPTATHKELLTPDQEVGKLFSEGKFSSRSSAGRALKDQIIEADNEAYKKVNKLYEESREANKHIQDIHPELVEKLLPEIERLKAIPELSGPSKDILTSLEKIVNRLVVRTESGNSYRPIPNQTLIEQIQELYKKVDYDFAHGGNTRNLFKPIINEIQQSVRNSASKDVKALTAYDKARSAYKEWADIFDNPYVRPFRDKTNKDYSKLYETSLSPDEFNQLKTILGFSKKGQNIQKALLRDLVEKQISPFTTGSKVDAKALTKALNELEVVVDPKQIKEIKDILLRKSSLEKKSIKAQAKSPYEGKTPEQISKSIDSVSALRNLKQNLKNTKGGEELYKKIAEQKASDVLTKGKLKLSEKASDIKSVLNDKENIAFLNEAIGPENVNKLRTIVDKLESLQEIAKEFQKTKDIPGHEKILNSIYDLITLIKNPARIVTKTIKNPLFIKDIYDATKIIGRSAKHSAKEMEFFGKKIKEMHINGEK